MPTKNTIRAISRAERNLAPFISIVVPVYNEEKSIIPFVLEVSKELQNVTDKWEFVFVNDGSVDNTIRVLLNAQKKFPYIRIFDLSRNFGKEAATTAGLDYARGDVVIPMDVDLQDPPHLIPQMIQKWRDGFDVVLAIRAKRDGDSWLRRYTAWGFYWLWDKISDTRIAPNAGDFRLLDRKVVEALRAIRERNRFMKGIFAWAGFRSTTISFDRPKRYAGRSAWSYCKLYHFALNGIFAFTGMPLKIWLYIGLVIALCSFVAALYLVVRTIILGVDVPGYASIMVAMLFLGGINLIGLGIIGQYIANIYNEVKQRPLYIISEQYNAHSSSLSEENTE